MKNFTLNQNEYLLSDLFILQKENEISTSSE